MINLPTKLIDHFDRLDLTFIAIKLHNHLSINQLLFFLTFLDPRTRDWPMMSSPFPTLAICLGYVYIVKVSRKKN